MGIEAMLQKAILERHTQEAPGGEPASARQRHRRSGSLPARLTAIVDLPIFLPALVIWGALIGAFAIMVLPGYTIIRMTMVAGLGALGGAAQYVYAALAAFIGGAVCWIIAVLLRRILTREPSEDGVAKMAGRTVRPIDPASELASVLGSTSLDAPLDEVPFGPLDGPANGGDTAHAYPESPIPVLDERAAEPAPERASGPRSALDRLSRRRTGETGLPTPREEVGLGPLPVIQPEEQAPEEFGEPLAPRPEAPEFEVHEAENPSPGAGSAVPLDLSQFTVAPPSPASEPAPEPAPEPTPQAEAAEAPAAAPASLTAATRPKSHDAVAMLRRVPPEQLSLVQMVERFAAALHDFQDAARRAPARGTALPQPAASASPERDQALAEALRALALFSERGFDTRQPHAPQSDSEQAQAFAETERELREALARLNEMRGAA